MRKPLYDEEMLSRILSARAGGQLVQLGDEWPEGGLGRSCCINQAAFLQDRLTAAGRMMPDGSRSDAKMMAGDWFDGAGVWGSNLGYSSKLSYERFLKKLESF